MVIAPEETTTQQKTEFEFHPLANIFPLMSRDELFELTKDISKNGLLEPIVLLDGKILDGRNRYKACLQINEKPVFVEFKKPIDPLSYVLSLNLHRRHLNSAQKAELGLIILEVERKLAKERQLSKLKQNRETVPHSEGVTEGNGEAIKKTAKRVGISKNTLYHWEKITKVSREDEEIAIAREKVLRGTRSIKSVFNQVKKKEREEQELLAQRFEPRENIVCDSLENLLEYLEPNSVDFILTDPPYPREYLPLWEILFDKAFTLLKEGGFLIAYTPHIYLPEIFRMKNHLRYVWTIAQIHTGFRASFHPSKVNIGWKPLLVFVKGKMPEIPYFDDILQGSGREKGLHNWQQALGEAEALIEIFSRPNQLVVDPFLGSGTTVIAAKNTNRVFFGMDNDKTAIQTTLRRLKE